MFYAQTPDGQGSPPNAGFYSSNLYASPHTVSQYDSVPRVSSPFNLGDPPSSLMMSGLYQDAPSARKPRKDSGNSYSGGRLTGACTRCKRLKVKFCSCCYHLCYSCLRTDEV